MYKNLASDLHEQGYDRDWEQCESKIKTEYTEQKRKTTIKQRGVGKYPCITMIWTETLSSLSSEATICTGRISWRAVSRT